MRMNKVLALAVSFLFFTVHVSHGQSPSLDEELDITLEEAFNLYVVVTGSMFTVVNMPMERKQIAGRLAQIREAYWEEATEGAITDATTISYLKLLVAKDMHYLNINLLAEIDDGVAGMHQLMNNSEEVVSPFVYAEYRRFVSRFLAPLPTNDPSKLVTSLVQGGLSKAIASSTESYATYFKRLRLAEYLFHNPYSPLTSSDPSTYMSGWLLATKLSNSIAHADREVDHIKKNIGEPNLSKLTAMLKEDWSLSYLKAQQFKSNPASTLNTHFIEMGYAEVIQFPEVMYWGRSVTLSDSMKAYTVRGTEYGLFDILKAYKLINRGRSPEAQNALLFKDGQEDVYVAGVDEDTHQFEVLPLPVEEINTKFRQGAAPEDIDIAYPGMYLIYNSYGAGGNYNYIARSENLGALHIPFLSDYLPIQLPEEQLQTYQGKYRIPDDRIVTVAVKDGVITRSFGDQNELVLHPAAADTFFVTRGGAPNRYIFNNNTLKIELQYNAEALGSDRLLTAERITEEAADAIQFDKKKKRFMDECERDRQKGLISYFADCECALAQYERLDPNREQKAYTVWLEIAESRVCEQNDFIEASFTKECIDGPHATNRTGKRKEDFCACYGEEMLQHWLGSEVRPNVHLKVRFQRKSTDSCSSRF